MMTTRNLTSAAALATVLAVLSTSTAEAKVAYTTIAQASDLVWTPIYLTSGVSVSLDTRNLSGNSGADTVLHLFFQDPTTHVNTMVAAADDCGTSLRSCLNYVPSTTGYYYVLVRAYNTTTGGFADLYQNGAELLHQVPFGGTKLVLDGWDNGDVFRAVGYGNLSFPADTMVALLSNTTTVLTVDDDSGANLYATAKATSTQPVSSFVVVGLRSGSQGTSVAVYQQPKNVPGPCINCTINDPDNDGVVSDLETLMGGNPSVKDSDGDMVPDGMELFGNDGFSFSEFCRYLKKDVFVEMDYMWDPNDPQKRRQPGPSLSVDVASYFSSQLSGQDVKVNLLLDDAVDFHDRICYGDCSAFADGVNFYDVKAAHFSVFNPERRPYFHYAVFAWKDGSTVGGCNSGEAEIPGNDIFVTISDGSCGFAGSYTETRNAFMHEFGHNFGLTHNGNDGDVLPDGGRQASVVHASVMNYRYTWSGVPDSGLPLYSHGPGSRCGDCATSPKLNCEPCQLQGACTTTPTCITCDCDLDEWPILNFDPHNDPNWADGAGPGPGFEPDNSGPLKAIPSYRGIVPEESAAAAARRVASVREGLIEKGLAEGVDFDVTPDGRHIYSRCR